MQTLRQKSASFFDGAALTHAGKGFFLPTPPRSNTLPPPNFPPQAGNFLMQSAEAFLRSKDVTNGVHHVRYILCRSVDSISNTQYTYSIGTPIVKD